MNNKPNGEAKYGRTSKTMQGILSASIASRQSVAAAALNYDPSAWLPQLAPETGVCEKQHPGKFGAKASLEAWSTASDAIFREESEFEVRNDPNLRQKPSFSHH